MTDLQDVIGLLHRADWARLSLSADVHSETDQDLWMSRARATKPHWIPEGRGVPEGRVWRFRENPENSPLTWDKATGEELVGYHSWDTRLLIAPGGRYRQEYQDEPSGRVIGSEGERSWVWDPQNPAPPGPPNYIARKPPLRELFFPSELLTEYTLEVRGPVTACDRDAIAVQATPRAGIGTGHGLRSSLADQLNVIVDAELGILLRHEAMFEGQRLSLTELTAVVVDPPEAADPSRFAPPAGSRISQDPGDSLRETFSGPGAEATKAVVGLASRALGAYVRFAPHRRDFSEGDLQEAMPPAQPAVLEPEGPPPSDDLLYLLYRSGQNPALTAVLDEWQDLTAMMAQVPEPVRGAGLGGLGYLIDSLDTVTHGKPVAHTVSRLRVGGWDKYRVDYLTRSGRNHLKTIACDGEHHWQAWAAQTVVGPARPMGGNMATVVDSSWLLGCRLSGGAEISYRGRRAYQLSVETDGDEWRAARLAFFPADVIVDAELGCLLRLISFAGDRPASWYELSGIDTEPVPAWEFRMDVPPGVRVVEETGSPWIDVTAVMPGATGCAVRTAADVVRRTSDAVSATRSFLDDLRGRSRS